MTNRAETQRMSDSELVRLAKDGCEDAFGELVRKYQRNLRGFLIRRIGDLATADDIAQDTFLVAVTQISTLSEDRSFRAWLFAVARNKAADCLRRKRRESLNENNTLEALLAEESLGRIRNHNHGDEEQLLKAMAACIESMKSRSKAILKSHYFDRVSCEQIAKVYGEKSGTVRMALLRIRKALAKCIRSKVGVEVEL